MPSEAKYIYGIIETDKPLCFGPIGIPGTQEVVTVESNGISAVVSNIPFDLSTVPVSRENLMTHARVIEKISESHTIIPMQFYTVAESTDEIEAFLKAQKRELKKLIKNFNGKVEVGIQIIWKDMKAIFQELAEENRTLRAIKKKGAAQSREELIHAGELVETALDEKKALEGETYLRILKKGGVNYQLGDLKTEDILFNAAFLIKRNQIKEFDARVEHLSDQHADRIEVKYVGPMVPFSFVKSQIHWQGE